MATKPRFNEVVNDNTHRYYSGLLNIEQGNQEELEQRIGEFNNDVKFLNQLMATDGSSRSLPRVRMDEALGSTDASILFPRVISDVLVRPKEPMLFLQNEVAKIVSVDTTNFIEFPTLGALRAFDVPDMGEYPEQTLPFTQHMTAVRVGKSGLALSLSEEIIKDSMWDILALYIEAAGYALKRFKEEKLVRALQDKGRVVFDNNIDPSRTQGLPVSAFYTGGRAYNGEDRNYSITYDDFIRLMAALVQHEYTPTHLLIHPMAWSIWATDPLLRTQFLHGGQLGQGIYRQVPQYDQQVNFPWSVQYRVTPFMPFSYSTTLSNNPGASGIGSSNVSDICLLDANNALIILQREGPSSEEWRDPRRDVMSMKLKERYGVSALNGGRSICWAKNIRLVQNYEAHARVIQVTP